MDEKDRKIAELEKQVQAMRGGEDIELSENIRRRTLQDIISAGVQTTASTGNVLQAVNEGATGTYNVTKAASKALRVTVDGTDYYLGLIAI